MPPDGRLLGERFMSRARARVLRGRIFALAHWARRLSGQRAANLDVLSL
jgi:hypothetical protein